MVHTVKVMVVYATGTIILSQLLKLWDGSQTVSALSTANLLRAPLARLMSLLASEIILLASKITLLAVDLISLALWILTLCTLDPYILKP